MSMVQRSDLQAKGPLTELGRGNEGIVYGIPGDTSRVYKEYISDCSTGPNTQALDSLIRLREDLSDDDRDWLDLRAAWPRQVVYDGTRMVGLAMDPLSDVFYRRYGVRTAPKRVVCSWMYLAMQNPSSENPLLIDEIPVLTGRQIWDLILDLSRLIELLHRKDIVLGDISGGNLLWTDLPQPRAFLIDCDSFRLVGSGGIGTPKQTPDWDDPTLGGKPTSKSSDIYKLGLAAFRAIARAKTDRPTPTISGAFLATHCHSGSAASALAALIGSSVAPTGRPDAADWVAELASGGRPRLALRPIPPRTQSGLPPPSQRGRIPLKPQ
jgi:hypothetical protein